MNTQPQYMQTVLTDWIGAFFLVYGQDSSPTKEDEHGSASFESQLPPHPC